MQKWKYFAAKKKESYHPISGIIGVSVPSAYLILVHIIVHEYLSYNVNNVVLTDVISMQCTNVWFMDWQSGI